MSAPIGVAVFTDNDFDKVNGVTTALSAVIAHAPADLALRVYTAARLGCDVPGYLALPSWGVGIPFYREMEMYWPPYRLMLERLRRDRVRVIHVTTPGPVGVAAIAAARRLALPLVGSFHTDLAAYTAALSGSPALGGLMRRYMRWLYGRCQHVLVPSLATRRLVEAAGTPSDRLSVWSRGVDAEHYRPSRRSAALRGWWRVRDDRPVVLYVGRLSKEKSVDLLPILHDRLVRLGLDHRLVVAGDGPLRSSLARQCPDAVCLGNLGKDDLAAVYASADLFVFPSRTDTAGNVVLEAQASGVPVLVSEAGGPREQMWPEVTGFVLGPDPQEWTVAAARLLSDHGSRRAMGEQARRFAERRTWPAALSPLYRRYRQLADANRDTLAPCAGGVQPRRVA